MRTIKIFLASSEELSKERESIADLVDNLNYKLRSQDLFIQLVKWEYLDSSMGPLHKQEEYNRELKDCELCMVLYWTRFGMYTKEELDTAYQELCAGRNPKKLYVYFKDSDTISQDLKAFRDGFPEKYGHFYCHFLNIDTLKADFLLQFMEYLNSFLKGNEVIEIKDSQVIINGKVYVNLQNVPFAGNNEEYNLLLKTIKKTRKLLAVTEPDDPEYAEYAAELNELEEKQSQMEASLWDTALMVTKLSNTHCSERLKRAMDLFGEGDNKGAQAILNEEEIEKDVQHNLRLIELGEEGRKGIKTNIEEYRLKIKTLKNELSEGWKEKALELYEKCITLGEKNLDDEVFAELLSDFGDFALEQCIYDKVEAAFLESNSILRGLSASENRDNYVLWNYVQLSVYYMNSGEFRKAEVVLNDALEIIRKQGKPKKEADTLDYLAWLYYEQQKYDEAEEIYKRVLSVAGPQEDEDFKGILKYTHYYLGLLYKAKGEFLQAIQEANEAMQIHLALIEKESDAGDVFISRLYELLGNCYDCLGRTIDAEEAFQKCLSEINKGNYSSSNNSGFKISKVCCLGNLSRIHKYKNDLELAIREATEALSIIKGLFNDYPIQHSTYYAKVVRDLASLFRDKKRYDEAIGLLEEAVSAYDIKLTTDDQKVKIDKESCLNLLGCIYLDQRRYDNARVVFRETSDLLSEIMLTSSRDYSVNKADVLVNLGVLELNTRHYDDAEKYLWEAYEIWKSNNYYIRTELETGLAAVELNIGFLYSCRQDWQRAKEWYCLSLDRLKNAECVRDASRQQWLIVQVLTNLSVVLGKMSDDEASLQYAREAKNKAEVLYKESLGAHKSLYFDALNGLAWRLYLTNNNVEAEQYAGASLQMAREMEDRYRLRESLDTNACICRELGKFTEAEALFLEAISICEQLNGEDEVCVAKQANEEKELAKLYEKAGRSSECMDYITKAKATFATIKDNSIIQSYAEDIQELEQLSK